MKISRFIAGLIFSFALLVAAHLSFAQLSQSGAGHKASSAAPITPPGDVVGSALAFWSLRCYQATYTGNVARIKSPSDALTTTITCSSGVLSSTGTGLATTCAVSCTIDIWYDQSGNSNCGAVPCDLSQPTEANRPTLVTGCQNSLNCLNVVGSSQTLCSNVGTGGAGITQSQPFTQSLVTRRTAITGTGGVVLISDPVLFETIVYFDVAADIVNMYATSVVSAAALDSTYNSLQAIFDSTSSSLYVNGSATTGDAGTGHMSGGQLCVGLTANHDTFRLTEVGVWGSAFTGTQAANMTTSQRAYWNF